MGAYVAIGAAAPVLIMLSEAVIGRWSLTQPVKIDAAAMTNPVTIGVFISIYGSSAGEFAPALSSFTAKKLVPVGGIEPPTKGL
jgi:hypothetical protein